MSILDIVIILVILFGAVVGFKHGFSKQLLSFLGLIVIISISFLLKNPVSTFLYSFFPFFKFGGIIKGVTVLNILLYEAFAFMFIFSILLIIYRFVILASNLFEKFLKMTIILGFFSKILGMILGAFEYFIIAFIIIFILNFPVFGFDIVNNSKFGNIIIRKTPLLNLATKKTTEMTERFNNLKIKYQNKENSADEFNLETLDLFLEYKIVSVKNIEKLIEKDKLKLGNVESVLQKYREEN